MIITHVGGPLDGQVVDVPRQAPQNLGDQFRHGPMSWKRKTKAGEIITEEADRNASVPDDWISYRVAVYVREGLTFHYLRDEEIDRCITIEKSGRRCGTISKVGSAHCDKHDRKYCAAILPSGRCKTRVEPGSDYCATHKKARKP